MDCMVAHISPIPRNTSYLFGMKYFLTKKKRHNASHRYAVLFFSSQLDARQLLKKVVCYQVKPVATEKPIRSKRVSPEVATAVPV